MSSFLKRGDGRIALGKRKYGRHSESATGVA